MNTPRAPPTRANADEREFLIAPREIETTLAMETLTAGPDPSHPQVPSGVQDPYATQGNYGYPAAPAPDYGAPLIPGFGASQAPSSYQQQQHQPQQQTYGQQPDPYGGYDAVNSPSIPDLIAHSQRSSAPPSAGYGGNNNGSASRSKKPQEVAGAPSGSNRYRCMLFPTCDGGDIDSVVCQVGLDGIALFEDDGARCGSEMTAHRYEMDKISKWRLADPTILTVKVAGRDGITSLSLSSDDATCAAMMDTMVTSAFQWCELRGHDPSDTIGDDGAGEWVNKKALVSAASGASSSSLNADTRTQVAAAVAAVQIAWHDAPEYCGWLTKKGEHLSMWRRRWFVLKDKKLGWFKDVNQANKPGVRPRGVIDLGKVISVCTATHADAGRAHGVELIGSVEAEKAGCKFLCADSEREGDGWATKLAEVCNDAAPTTEQSQPAPGSSSAAAPAPAPTPSSQLASQLARGYQTSASSGAPSGAHGNGNQQPLMDINVSVTDYAQNAQNQNQNFGADPYLSQSAQGAWDTYYTNEGVAYYVNSQTGVTQWEKPA